MTSTPQQPIVRAARYGLPSLAGLGAASAFALSDVLVKFVLLLGCDVFTMLSFRSALGLAFIAAWFGFSGRPKAERRVRWISAGNGLLFAAGTFCLFEAIDAIDVPTAILAYFVYPLLTGLGAALLGLEPFRWRGVLCAVAAFCGLAVMVGAHPAGFAFAGVVYALGAAGCRTGLLLVTRAYLTGVDARLTTWYTQLSSTLVFAALSLAAWDWQGPHTSGGWLALIAVSISTTAGIQFVFLSTARIGPFRTALIMFLEPLLTMLLSAPFLGEVITPMQGVGSAVMLAALVTFQLWR